MYYNNRQHYKVVQIPSYNTVQYNFASNKITHGVDAKNIAQKCGYVATTSNGLVIWWRYNRRIQVIALSKWEGLDQMAYRSPVSTLRLAAKVSVFPLHYVWTVRRKMHLRRLPIGHRLASSQAWCFVGHTTCAYASLFLHPPGRGGTIVGSRQFSGTSNMLKSCIRQLEDTRVSFSNTVLYERWLSLATCQYCMHFPVPSHFYLL